MKQSFFILLLLIFTFGSCAKKTSSSYSKSKNNSYSASKSRSSSKSKSSSSSQRMVFIKQDFAKAQAQAKKQNKPIFIDFYTSWCGPCKKMDRDVFSDRRVSKYYNENYVSLKINAEQGDGRALADKYKVKGFPTLCVIDPSGKMISQVVGYQASEDVLRLGKKGLSKMK